MNEAEPKLFAILERIASSLERIAHYQEFTHKTKVLDAISIGERLGEKYDGWDYIFDLVTPGSWEWELAMKRGMLQNPNFGEPNREEDMKNMLAMLQQNKPKPFTTTEEA